MVLPHAWRLPSLAPAVGNNGAVHLRLLRLMALALLLLLVVLPASSWAAPWIGVRGNHLIDGRGETVRLLGVNRSGAEYECVEGDGIFDGPTDRASIRAMKSWHINAVRLPLNESCWLGINGVDPALSGATYRQRDPRIRRRASSAPAST